MDNAKLIELAEDVAGLKVGMAGIDAKLGGLIHPLLGNGQPGIIAELRSTDRAMSQRIDKGENRTQWLAEYGLERRAWWSLCLRSLNTSFIARCGASASNTLYQE
jgi:hypothetical protein